MMKSTIPFGIICIVAMLFRIDHVLTFLAEPITSYPLPSKSRWLLDDRWISLPRRIALNHKPGQ
jgi:hypothetical protein